MAARTTTVLSTSIALSSDQPDRRGGRMDRSAGRSACAEHGLMPARSRVATATRVLAAPLVLAVTACGGGGPAADTGGAGTPVSRMPSDLQDAFVRVVRDVAPKVVQIQNRLALGSGVVFDARGNVVTNAHVVQGARRFVVTLANGQRHPARLIGADKANDLAVVQLEGATPAPAHFGDSSSLQVGDLVLAIGNPLGLRSSVTQGIVSSLGRTVSEGGGLTLSPVIQTSAAINPGNSGGALVDLAGRVVGIPTLAALDPEMGGAQAPGIGFAIPSATVTHAAARLVDGT
jgi:S1-C subfamily serine protease